MTPTSPHERSRHCEINDRFKRKALLYDERKDSMKNDRLIDLGLTGYEELFMSTEERLDAKKPKVEAIPLTALTPFRMPACSLRRWQGRCLEVAMS